MKDIAADKLAQSHYRVDLGIVGIYRLLEKDEDGPGKPIKLLEINKDAIAGEIIPMFFDSFSSSVVSYPVAIIEVTGTEWKSIVSRQIRLPNGWWVGEKIERVAYNGICGVHYCDHCGDCMVCHGEERCYYGGDGEHYCSEMENQE